MSALGHNRTLCDWPKDVRFWGYCLTSAPMGQNSTVVDCSNLYDDGQVMSIHLESQFRGNGSHPYAGSEIAN